MKVWVVMRFNWDSGTCVGVFSSKALAYTFLKAFSDPENYNVEEQTVDGPKLHSEP